MNFPETLRRLRASARLSRAELADRSGVPRRTLEKWEQGEQQPQWAALFAVCRGLGVEATAFADCDELREITPTPKPAAATPAAATPTTFGETVRRLRESRGLTLTALAESVGVSKQLLSQIENDQAQPSLSVVRKIANAFGVGIAELFANCV